MRFLLFLLLTIAPVSAQGVLPSLIDGGVPSPGCIGPGCLDATAPAWPSGIPNYSMTTAQSYKVSSYCTGTGPLSFSLQSGGAGIVQVNPTGSVTASVAGTYTPVVRCNNEAGDADASFTLTVTNPTVVADYVVPTKAAMLALSGTSIGEDVYVESENRYYDIVNESGLTWKVIDQAYTLIFDEDRIATTTASIPTNSAYTNTTYATLLQPNVVFGSLNLSATGVSVKDLELSGHRYTFTSVPDPHIPLVNFVTGGLSSYSQSGKSLQTLLESGGATTFTATYDRVTTAKRLRLRGWTHYNPMDLGATGYLQDSTINDVGYAAWALTWDAQNSAIDTTYFSEAIGIAGSLDLKDGQIVRCNPAGPCMKWLGDNQLFAHKLAPTNLSRLDAADPALSFEAVQNITLIDFWIDGNGLENMAWLTDPSYGLEPINFQNTPQHSFQQGNQANRPLAPSPPGTITLKGDFRVEEFISNNLTPGHHYRYNWVFDTGARAFLGCNINYNNHLAYGMDGYWPDLTLTSCGGDMIAYHGRTQIGVLRSDGLYQNPTDSRKRQVFQFRDGPDDCSPAEPCPYDSFKIDSLDLDLRDGYNDFFTGSGAYLDIGAGDVLVSGMQFLTGTQQGYQGVIGPPDGKKLRFIRDALDPSSMRLMGSQNGPLALTGDLTMRNVEVVAPTPSSNNGDQHFNLPLDADAVRTVTVENVTTPDAPGSVATLRAGQGVGLDFVFRGSSVHNKAAHPVRQLSSQTSTISDLASAKRVRFLCENSTFDGPTGPAAFFDRVFRGRDCADHDGQTSEDAGTFVSDTGDEGASSLTIPTNLLWAAREANFSVASDDQPGTPPTVTAWEYRKGAVAYSFPVSGSTDFSASDLVVTLSRPIAVGEILTVTWDAAVTPDLLWRYSRPRESATPMPSLANGAGASVVITPSTYFVNTDSVGAAGAGSLTYTVVSSNPSVATVTALGGSGTPVATPAPTPITTPTFDATGQSTHPDVMDMAWELADRGVAGTTWPTGGGGYRYWMWHTPYPFAQSNDHEFPSLLTSTTGDDGTWALPTGTPDPVFQTTDGYYADNDAILSPGADTMFVFFKHQQYPAFPASAVVISYSTDGVTWADTTEIITLAGGVPDPTVESPAVVYNASLGRYEMYAMKKDGTDTRRIQRYTATNPLARKGEPGGWTGPTLTTLNNFTANAGGTPWHLDVRLDSTTTGREYRMAVILREYDDEPMNYCTSPEGDGLNWDCSVLMDFDAGIEWTTDGFYRPTLVPTGPDIGGVPTGYRMWYGGISSANEWHIGETSFSLTGSGSSGSYQIDLVSDGKATISLTAEDEAGTQALRVIAVDVSDEVVSIDPSFTSGTLVAFDNADDSAPEDGDTVRFEISGGILDSGSYTPNGVYYRLTGDNEPLTTTATNSSPWAATSLNPIPTGTYDTDVVATTTEGPEFIALQGQIIVGAPGVTNTILLQDGSNLLLQDGSNILTRQ